MKKQKKKQTILVIFLLVTILTLAYLTREKIVVFVLEDIFHATNKTITPPPANEYKRDWNYEYVQNTKDFSPKNKQDIKNIYYTILNSGVTSYSFYCPKTYKDCISDVKEISSNKTIISSINNYVHPFNSFRHLETNYDKLGKITLKVEKTYSKSKQKRIKEVIDHIIKDEIKDETNPNEQIKIAHDYIINHTKYDSNKSDNKNAEYDSDTAYGALIQGYALCGGYTDAMTLVLDELDIKNFKIASDNHIWSAVYLENAWYHLDLTWDDPVTDDKSDVLEYNFYMITTEELNELKTNYHNYDKKIYKEL